MRDLGQRLRSWEGMLLAILLVVVALNALAAPGYLTIQNQVNLFELSVEKAIVVLVMTFVIISGEIDLSVASVMGLSAVVVAVLSSQGVPTEVAIVVALAVGALCGLANGFWIAIVGLPSLAVTLAGLIGYRGLARVLIEDRSVGGFPEWFENLGQQPILGPLPLALIIFVVMVIGATIILSRSGFGRYVYVLGSNIQVARFSGVRTARVRLTIFTASGLVAALSGVLLAARLGAVRGSTAEGFELDIITMVLLGGVSIFGGRGTMPGVILSILLILNLRNGLGLANVTGNTQTGIIGVLLILSVLIPNLVAAARSRFIREDDIPVTNPGMTQVD
jgi:rhamnose transport system permease protein